MKTTSTHRGHILASVTLASLAFAGGCKTESTENHAVYYSEPTPYAGAGGTSSTKYSTGQAASASTAYSSTSPSMQGQTNLAIPLYKESVVVGKHDVDAGSVRVKKIVKTETVNEPVELRHEEVVIERIPASGQPDQGKMQGQAFEENETVIHLTREEPVVEKQLSASDQIVLQRRSASEQTNIQTQIRSEDVDVAKFGNAQNVTIGENVHASSQGAAGGAESPGGQATGKGSPQTSGTITDPAMLSSSTDPQTLAGRHVQLSNLRVQDVFGDQMVLLYTYGGQSFYATYPSSTAHINPNDTVNVTGTIKTSVSPGTLSAESTQTLGAQPFYIDAQKIDVAK